MDKPNSRWYVMHPRQLTAASDLFYDRLYNTLNSALLGIDRLEKMYFRDLTCSFIARMATGYLEDKASGFGVWDAFISLCRTRYGKDLPFFSLENYDPESVNYADVEFLVWMSAIMTGRRKGIVYSPKSVFVAKTATAVYNIIAGEWENAPEAIRVTNYIDGALRSADWIEARPLAEWLAYFCYLTSVPDLFDVIREEASRENKKAVGTPQTRLYGELAFSAVVTPLRPLGAVASEYLAVMAEKAGYADSAARWRGLESYGMTVYKVLSVSPQTVSLECACRLSMESPLIGEKLNLAADSLQSLADVAEDRYILAPIVKWGDSCVLNGMMLVYKDIPAFEKLPVPPLTPEMKSDLTKHMEEIIAKNDGSRIAYFETWKDLYDFFGIPENLRPEKMKAPMDGNGLTCYISGDGSQEVSLISGKCLKDPRNPFYDREDASRPGRVMGLLVDGAGLSRDALRYAASRGMLVDGNLVNGKDIEGGKALVADNLDFWIDFFNSRLDAGK